MELTDILKLKNEPENLNIISDYLNKPLVQFEYEGAILTYVKIANNLELFELSLKEGTKYLKTIVDRKATKYRVDIYYNLFRAALSLKKYDLSLSFIAKRKELLPQLEQYKSLIDELEHLKALNEDYLDVLLNLKREIIPKDILLFVNEELYQYFFNKKDYQNAENILKELYELTLNNKYANELIKLIYLQEKYELVITKTEELIENNNNDLYSIIYYISALRITKKHRKANTIEAEYEKAIDNNSDDNFKLFAYNEIIKLYEEQNSQVSIGLYKEKLKSIKKQVKTKPKEEIREVIKVTEIKTSQVLRDAKYIEYFSFIKEWLVFSKSIKLNETFREYLRQLFIEIDKKVTFEDVIIYANNYFDSNLYHYKKGRLYDKKVIDFYIENTIISEVLQSEKAVFGTPEYLKTTKNILTQKPIDEDIKYLYGIYINKEVAIAFNLEEEVKDPGLIYELLSGIATIINLRLLDEVNNKRLNNEAKYLDNIINNPIMPMRRMTIGRSLYNEKAIELFKIDNKLHIELFLREVELEDAKKYQKVIERLFSYPNETNVIKYNFQDLIIIEYLFAVKINDEVTIFSYFVDSTKNYITEEELTIKANYDSETGLKNKNYFEENINPYLEDKTTFVLIELNQTVRNIYGNERMNKFFVEFAQATKKHFNENDLYRYDFNQLLLVLNYNDIRTVTNTLNNYFNVINHLQSNVLKYEPFKANAGILRYPVVTTEKRIDKLYRYLDIALSKAKLEHNDFIDFTYRYYEEDIFEQEVIDYLNEAIENKKLSIRFKQIINLEQNIIANYESEIYLPNINVDSKYLISIAKKRNKLIELEYYHLELIASFLNELDKDTNYLINITIPISEETFLSNEFENHFTATLKKYKIPAEFIKVLCDVKLTKQKDIAKAQKLINYGITLETTNIETILNADFKSLHLNYHSNNKWRNYLELTNQMLKENNLTLTIRNVSKPEIREQLRKIGINYIEGEIYRKISAEDLMKQIKGNLNENNN